MKETLSTYRDRTLAHILRYIPDKEPKKYLYDLVSCYPERGGKGFRPALCIASCKAHGGSQADVMNTAVALELFHNAFLVHDDVEDKSCERRGAPTINADYGPSIAVNLGDAMNVLSFSPLMENLNLLGPTLTWQIFREIQHMIVETVEGQAIELGWIRDNTCKLTDSDYLRMCLKKTCWYTSIHPIRIGAIIGTRGKIDPDRFNRFGYYMGAAFQIQDDLLNLEAAQAKYGKEIGGDLLEAKRTLMLIHLLNNCNSRELKYLRDYLSRERAERSLEEADSVLKWMKKYGSLEYGRKNAQMLTGAALGEFKQVFDTIPDSSDKRFLQDIIYYMIERDY